jgi:hypothetical protein
VKISAATAGKIERPASPQVEPDCRLKEKILGVIGYFNKKLSVGGREGVRKI